MKKFLTLFLAFLTVICLISCGEKSNGQSEDNTEKYTEEITLTIGVVDGAPSLSVANILDGGFYKIENGKKYSFEISLVGGAPQIRAGLLSGDYDLAIAPLNLAASIYNAKAELGIRLASVNIFGCLYLIGDSEISDLNELKGKTVITVGAGGTPDVVLRNLLSKNDVLINAEDENDSEKVNITYANDAAGVIQAFTKGEADYAVLGEPAVTTVSKKLGKTVALDIQAEWKKVYGDVNFVQAGLFATGKVPSGVIDALVEKLSENKQFVNENLDKLTSIFTKADSTLKNTAFSEELISRCNIGCKKASLVKDDVIRFLTAVYEYSPAQVGGKLPDDDFYI